MKKLLVVVDNQNDDSLSLQKSREIANIINVSIEIVKFLPKCDESESEQFSRLAKEKQNLTQKTEDLFKSKTAIPVSIQVVCTDNQTAWIIDMCSKHPIDIVVKTEHHTETIIHMPTQWQLIRQLNSPLYVTADKKWKSHSAVMLTIDLSTDEERHGQLNNLVLQWAKLWAGRTRCALHIVSVIPLPKPLLDLDLVEKNNYEAKKKPGIEQKINALLKKFDLTDVQIHISAGTPDKIILHTANALKADLVIMGCVGREGIKGFLLGNTAEKVLTHLHTDLLIVKPNSTFSMEA